MDLRDQCYEGRRCVELNHNLVLFGVLVSAVLSLVTTLLVTSVSVGVSVIV
jgi:hypothetical protein